jgi:ABC transporter, permease protein
MKKLFKKESKRGWTANEKQIYIMACAGVAFLLVFSYLPMYGVLLAFKNANKALDLQKALFNADWVGVANFKEFLTDKKFIDVFINTIGLNLLMLLINFPAPILFALLINEVRVRLFRNSVVTIASFPHFISWVIFGGIFISLTDMTTGVINPILEFFRLSSKANPVDLRLPQYFWAEMIIVSLIKNVGWGSIVYIAAIAGIDSQIYEAAKIDGANRLQTAVRITVPLIAPTITVFLLLNISKLLGNSFEQFYSMQTTANLSRSEVLATYIYSTGFGRRKYSYAAAMGLFDSVISLALLIVSNAISKKTTGRGLF